MSGRTCTHTHIQLVSEPERHKQIPEMKQKPGNKVRIEPAHSAAVAKFPNNNNTCRSRQVNRGDCKLTLKDTSVTLIIDVMNNLSITSDYEWLWEGEGRQECEKERTAKGMGGLKRDEREFSRLHAAGKQDGTLNCQNLVM